MEQNNDFNEIAYNLFIDAMRKSSNVLNQKDAIIIVPEFILKAVTLALFNTDVLITTFMGHRIICGYEYKIIVYTPLAINQKNNDTYLEYHLS